MKKRLKLPSPALVVSLVALFVALGGTGYAALRLPRNSVGTIQLRNGAVVAAKIRNGVITGAKLKNGTVTAGKIDVNGLTVPNSIHATEAVTAMTSATATSATTAGTATTASSAGTLASGKTETGVYAIEVPGAVQGKQYGAAITFPFPLAVPATKVEWVAQGGSSDANCPGSAASPQAAAGYLCLYASADENVASRCVADATGSCTSAAYTYGAVPELTAGPAAPVESVGTWAVTAP